MSVRPRHASPPSLQGLFGCHLGGAKMLATRVLLLLTTPLAALGANSYTVTYPGGSSLTAQLIGEAGGIVKVTLVPAGATPDPTAYRGYLDVAGAVPSATLGFTVGGDGEQVVLSTKGGLFELRCVPPSSALHNLPARLGARALQVYQNLRRTRPT